MRYLSTRDQEHTTSSFCDILLEGLAPDGGLYLPEQYPTIGDAELNRWRDLLNEQGYAALAADVLTLFIDDIPADDLKDICARAYTTPKFSEADIVTVTPLEDGIYLGGLSHGPTAAFKDMAMQLLGELFEYELKRRHQVLNILGATSGDTGSSAEYAMRGRDGISVFMLTPRGRMTAFQQAQMFSIDDPNVVNMAVDGVFDDCQDVVKAVSGDLEYKAANRIGAVNSINWARLMAQVVYYFYAAVRLGAPDRPIAFSVPTGNFGDVFAGYVASKMGLPVAKLVVATNVNDILHRALSEGDYSQGQVVPTATPSMDIQVSSNFERLLFDAGGRDGLALAQQMQGFEASKAMRLTNAQREGAANLFTSARIDADGMTMAMRWAFDAAGQVIESFGHVLIGGNFAGRTVAVLGVVVAAVLGLVFALLRRSPSRTVTGVASATAGSVSMLTVARS